MNKNFSITIIILVLLGMSIKAYSRPMIEPKPAASSVTAATTDIEITLYTIEGCPFCANAKALLDKKGLKYRAIPIDNDSKQRDKLIKETKQETVPYIFINNNFIGGYTELKKLSDSGGLK